MAMLGPEPGKVLLHTCYTGQHCLVLSLFSDFALTSNEYRQHQPHVKRMANLFTTEMHV
jgi:hypothetical protein